MSTLRKEDILAQADTTFRTVLGDPNNPNARVIAPARRNDEEPSLEEAIIRQADHLEDRVEDAMRALAHQPPADLDRFRH